MKKVFYRCTETDSAWWTVGKEYEADCYGVIDDSGDRYAFRELEVMISDGGRRPTGWSAGFHRIEREVFTADGGEWFKHTPGDPMPCDGDSLISYVMKMGTSDNCVSLAKYLEWHADSICPEANIIGWRFADSAKPEVQRAQVDGNPVSNGNLTYYPGTTADLSEYIECAEDEGVPYALYGVDQIKVGGLTFPSQQENDEMMCADMPIAAMDDGHLTPGQKAYIQAKEDAQAAKQQLAKDAQDKALQERAEQLSDAGKAMDRVNQDHDHRYGAISYVGL